MVTFLGSTSSAPINQIGSALDISTAPTGEKMAQINIKLEMFFYLKFFCSPEVSIYLGQFLKNHMPVWTQIGLTSGHFGQDLAADNNCIKVTLEQGKSNCSIC